MASEVVDTTNILVFIDIVKNMVDKKCSGELKVIGTLCIDYINPVRQSV